MAVLVGIGVIALSFGFAWALGEILVKAFEKKVKRIVRRCKREWAHPGTRKVLRRVFISEENYIEHRVEEALKKSGLFEEVSA